MGRNPSRSLIFKQNSGVVQFGADVEIAVQVKSDEKLRVRRRGGKNLHKVRRFLVIQRHYGNTGCGILERFLPKNQHT